MQWLNEPPHHAIDGDMLRVTTGSDSDFWRKTHYGFIRDSGHFLYRIVDGDFTAQVTITGAYRDLYDQAGLLVRLDETVWMKCGIEYVSGIQQASVVVTRDYSDWSVIPLPSNPRSVWMRVTRKGETIEVAYSFDGEQFTMLRMAYLAEEPSLMVGPMCASPEGQGFEVVFEGFESRKC